MPPPFLAGAGAGGGSRVSFQTMQAELRGSIPKLSYTYAGTLINRAYEHLRERNLWSFQLFEGQWIAPAQFVGVSAAVTQGSSTVTLSTTDSTNLAALLATQTYSVLNQRQFRVGSGGYYNIFNSSTTGGVTTLTLDRYYGEITSPATAFAIYQIYYVPIFQNAPITDFKTWISVRDMINFTDLFTERYTRAQIDAMDPQRTWYGIPSDVVPYQIDQNPASATAGAMMFELWGAPIFNINYQLLGIRKGLPLVKPTDTLPYALNEQCVMAKARVLAYEWAEANKNLTPRNQGPDFKFLIGAAAKEYDTEFRKLRQQDRETVDNWFSVRRQTLFSKYFGYYSTLTGTANPGMGGY